MTDERTTAGEMVEIFDVDFDAVKKELHDTHRQHCESDENPYIWVDEDHAWTDGRNLYVAAECLNCMKGSDRTAIRENERFHKKTAKPAKRHRPAAQNRA